VASIRDIHNAWRDSLIIASFKGAPFHVEASSRQSGRRTVVHEYPKRNSPYSEDMGRHAVRWSFTAYVIHGDRLLGNVMALVDGLILALESDDAGVLIHPLLGTMLCMCDRYSYSDNRSKGGYFEFDLSFVEAGAAVSSVGFADAGATLGNSTQAAENNAASSITQATQKIPLPVARPASASA
jgi:prophage DNA circulation protein